MYDVLNKMNEFLGSLTGSNMPWTAFFLSSKHEIFRHKDKLAYKIYMKTDRIAMQKKQKYFVPHLLI